MKHKLIQDIINTEISALSNGLSFKRALKSVKKMINPQT